MTVNTLLCSYAVLSIALHMFSEETFDYIIYQKTIKRMLDNWKKILKKYVLCSDSRVNPEQNNIYNH